MRARTELDWWFATPLLATLLCLFLLVVVGLPTFVAAWLLIALASHHASWGPKAHGLEVQFLDVTQAAAVAAITVSVLTALAINLRHCARTDAADAPD